MIQSRPPRSLLSCLAVALAALAVPARAQDPTRFAAERPLDCLHIRLDLAVDLPSKHVEGTARLEMVALRELSTITLDAMEFRTHAVSVARNGGREHSAAWRHDGTFLEIDLKEPMAPGDRATVKVTYAVDDPSRGLSFYGPTDHERDVPYLVWSQGETTFNSYWFPCFDNPNEMQTTELVVTTEAGYRVSSNGRLVSTDEDAAAGTVTYHWKQEQPHVAYLVSMIVGEFHVERETWRGKAVEYWAHPRYQDRIARSFRNTTRMLDYFSDAIGVEYPWDRYAQIACYGFGGGMENTSATTLGERSLHDERSMLDGGGSDGLIAHELAHQWFGDLLTCRDWAHLWLNEGFASYFEALWAEYDLGADEFAYNMRSKAASARSGGTERPVVDREYPYSRSMFDSRAYPKGAWVVHMLRRRLGDEQFWRVINRYTTDFAYQSVETVDLRKTAEQLTGRSFERFFHDWTERPGHPELSVATKWLADDGMVQVKLSQKQDGAAFHFPLTIEFRSEGADPVTVTREMTAKELTLYQPLDAAPTMVRVDPEQAVLMELEETKGRDLWEAQLRGDPSARGRADAAVHFGESRVKGDHELLAKALAEEPFWGVQVEIAKALAKAGGDIARDALVAGLALEDARARRQCAQELRSFEGDEVVIEALRPIVAEGDPSYRVEAAAIESYAQLKADDAQRLLEQALERDSRREEIRSAALSGLGRLGDPETVPILVAWSKPDKPALSRPSAVSALARVTRESGLSDEAWDLVIETLTETLDDTGRWVRSAAVSALGDLGEPARARSAIGKLRAVAANDASDRLRSRAERTIEAIQKGTPANAQLDDLRAEVKELLEENKRLTDRLEKLEGRLNGEGDND